jgi:hypothetical protein
MAAMKELPLSMLTKKLTTLLALLTAQCCQTLSSLDLDFMQEIDNEIIFTIREKLKTTKAGKHLPPIKILSYCTLKTSVSALSHISNSILVKLSL